MRLLCNYHVIATFEGSRSLLQAQRDLSKLAHASFTALAKRSPGEVRSAVGNFSAESEASGIRILVSSSEE